MEILLWLVPPAVVTALAMLWVAWAGRPAREVDPDEAVRRLGTALEKDHPARARAPRSPHERSTGVAVRRPRPAGPAPRDLAG